MNAPDPGSVTTVIETLQASRLVWRQNDCASFVCAVAALDPERHAPLIARARGEWLDAHRSHRRAMGAAGAGLHSIWVQWFDEAADRVDVSAAQPGAVGLHVRGRTVQAGVSVLRDVPCILADDWHWWCATSDGIARVRAPASSDLAICWQLI